MGGRSRAAAQFLQGRGFSQVYNLAGGIKAWDGLTAEGPQEWGLDLLEPGDGAVQAIAAAYALEQGLGQCYRKMADNAGDSQVAGLLRDLAGIEDIHKQRLQQAMQELAGQDSQGMELESREAPVRMEGGYTIDEFIKEHGATLKEPQQALMLAMSLETQALDLYLRLAQRAWDQGTHDTLVDIAGEEQAHLASLAKMLDSLAGN